MIKTTYALDLFELIQTYKRDVEEDYRSVIFKGIVFAFLFTMPLWFLIIITVIWLF